MTERVIYLTSSEAARALGVSTDMVRIYERTGRLPAIRTAGGYRLFTQLDVARLARKRAARRRQKAS
jgi:excisionase family DNA binding protein